MAMKTSSHCIGWVWRNRRTFGYQGLSIVPMRQRQSAVIGIGIQVSTPSAPPRWATAVSALMRMSICASAAAVSPKSRKSAERSMTPGGHGATPSPGTCNPNRRAR